MLASSPFLLAPRRPCPNSMHPHSMCVHAKAKTRKPADKQWKEYAWIKAQGRKANKQDRYGKHSMGQGHGKQR